MAHLISLSIDLKKIDRSKIIHGKNGQEYYPMTLSLNDTKDDYGNDCSLIDAQSKMEREAKEKKNFIGNGKIFWRSPAPVSVVTSNEAPY